MRCACGKKDGCRLCTAKLKQHLGFRDTDERYDQLAKHSAARRKREAEGMDESEKEEPEEGAATPAGAAAAAAPGFKVGDIVEAKFPDGLYYPATIAIVSAATVGLGCDCCRL